MVHEEGTEDDAKTEVLVLPKISVSNIKSEVGILRITQLLLTFFAFLCLQISITCKWIHKTTIDKQFSMQLCDCPGGFVFHSCSAVTATVFLVNLVMYGLHISNLMDVLTSIPWRLIMLIQTGASTILLVLVVIIIGYETYIDDTGLLLAVQFLSMFASVTFAFHFAWEFIIWKKVRSGVDSSSGSAHCGESSFNEDDSEI